MYYWQTIMHVGPSVSAQHGASFLSLDRSNIRVFQIMDDRTGRIIFSTSDYILAYRRRVAMTLGKGQEVVHLVEKASGEVVSVFEADGKAVRQLGYGREWWNRAIEYLPGERPELVSP